MKQWFQKKILQPLLDILKQGVSIEKMSWTLSFGVVICCFPVLGTTSFLCLIAAAIFKLNHVAIQIANYVAYPLQFIFLIPFLHLGNKIFGYPKMDLNIQNMILEFQADAFLFLKNYGGLALRASAAWLVIAPVAIVIGYFLFKPVVRILFQIATRKKEI